MQLQCTPALDPSTVERLKITIERIFRQPHGGFLLHVVSGNIGFAMTTPYLPHLRENGRYFLEYPKGNTPLRTEYTAIYEADVRPQPPVSVTKEKTMNALTLAPEALTITSREIAELANRTHKNVMRDIRAMIDAIEQGSNLNPFCKTTTYIGTNGQPYDQYELDKDTCLTLLLGYDPVARMKVVKRWQELEAGTAQPAIPQNLPDALRLAATLAEERQQLANKLQEVAPKAAALERIAHADGSLCLTDAAKTLQIPRIKLTEWLQAHRWIYRRTGNSHFVAYQDKIQSLLLMHKVTTHTKSDGTEKIAEQVRVTPKGLAKLSEQLAH